MDNFYYIYNPFQANFMVMNDCKVIEVGLGSKYDVYVKFLRDNFTENIVMKWKERKH